MKTYSLDERHKESADLHDRWLEIHLQTTIKTNTSLVYISAGSISLLLTFVGIIYSGDRSVENVDFGLIFWAVVAMLLAMTCLLLSNYLQSLVVYRRHLYNFQLWGDMNMMVLKAQGVAVDKMLKKKHDPEEEIDKTEKAKAKLPLFNKAHECLQFAGYAFIIVAYALSLVFFLDIFKLLGQPAVGACLNF